jgi:hypothetical protein
MRKLILIFSILSTTAFAQLSHDVRIVHEDSRSLTLEFTPQFSTQTLKGAGGQKLERISFEGEIAEQGKPGTPWISYRALPVQFPTSHVSVIVVSAESRIEEGMRPLPIPKMVPDKQFGWSPLYQAGTVAKLPTQTIAEVTDVARSQGKFIGTLRLYPVEYDQSANRAKLFTKLVVRIDFDAWSVSSVRASLPAVGNPQGAASSNVPTVQRTTANDSPLAQGVWYKMQVNQTGIYKIDQAFLQKANIAPSSIGNINSIRIFGNGGRMLPEDLTQSRPNGLEEIARFVVDNNGNGVFDADDYVLFYGVSTRGWEYDPATKKYTHYFSYYSNPNEYFLTFGGTPGLAMDTIASTDLAGAFTPNDFQEKIFFKQERYNLIASGREWVGQVFDYFNTTAVYTNSLPGYVASSPVRYRFVFWSRSSSYDGFTVYESGQQLGPPIPTFPVDVNPSDNENNYAYITPQVSFVGSGTISDNRSNVKIVFSTNNQAAKGWIDYMDLLYRRSFDAGGSSLLFDSPDTTALVEYVVHNLPTSNVFVFDVTDHQAVKRITQVRTDVADGTVRRFQVAQTAGGVKSFAVAGLSGTLTPASVAQISNSNLHGFSPGADFVIVAPTAFADQAQRFAAYRQAHDSLQSMVATLDNIQNEFSGGLLDPMAIRDFLKYAETTWTVKPKYVLLFGNGHYDYKNILSTTPNWIPPYESMESNYQIHSFCSDDFFAMLDAGNPRISIAIGRIPARSADDAKSMVDKIIQYETNSPFDPWRNRITFVADDGLTSSGDDGNIHTAQAEDLANNHTPDSFEKDKIYLSMYPTVLSATGRTKPGVNKAIVAAINRGTLITNFSGHGNTQQWTHEAVFTQAADLPQLVNLDRLTFLVAATCNFAEYDDPTQQSAGEEILVMNKGGAAAEVTSSRAVYQYSNQQFNNQLYDNLFPRDANGEPRRLGDAMWLTKQVFYATASDDWNAAKYHLLGDPTMRLDVPRAVVSLDSVNGRSTAQVDTMKALGTVTVNGIVRNPDGTPWPAFNGTGIIEVFDSQRQVLLQDINYTVDVIGSVLYRGEVSVTNGAYRAMFPIPKDVTYGNRSRLSLYAWNSTTDGVGYTENVTINGTDSTAAADTSGPQISIYFDDQSFRPGDRVKPNTTLYVQLQSRNGINTSTVGIGHGLQAVLNNSTDIDLTDYYRGDLNTYQSGQVQYQMADLAEGKYTLLVKAWDIRNNSSQAQTSFVVSSSNDLEMVNLVNYPNPFSHSTTFTFQRNSEDPIDVEVKIYTIAGRLIQHLDSYAVTDRFVQVPWDGRDRDGDPLANGVYFYKVTARTEDRRMTKEQIGKLAIMR